MRLRRRSAQKRRDNRLVRNPERFRVDGLLAGRPKSGRGSTADGTALELPIPTSRTDYPGCILLSVSTRSGLRLTFGQTFLILALWSSAGLMGTAAQISEAAEPPVTMGCTDAGAAASLNTCPSYADA